MVDVHKGKKQYTLKTLRLSACLLQDSLFLTCNRPINVILLQTCGQHYHTSFENTDRSWWKNFKYLPDNIKPPADRAAKSWLRLICAPEARTIRESIFTTTLTLIAELKHVLRWNAHCCSHLKRIQQRFIRLFSCVDAQRNNVAPLSILSNSVQHLKPCKL